MLPSTISHLNAMDYSSPHVRSEYWISHTHTHTHTHARAHCTSPTQAGTRPGAPQPSLSRLRRLSPPTRTPRGRNPAPGGRAAPEPLSGPRRGWEGAAQGSDGQSRRPIEPSTAFPKGGSGSSDGPNERGARVGLPPGIPLARKAGLWVTRKLGGRWRRQRLGSPVSDTGPPSPKPGRAAGPHRHPSSLLRAEAPPGARVPLLRAHPLLLVATKSRSGNRREGAGSCWGGTPSSAGAAGPKSGQEDRRPAASGDKREDSPLKVCGGPPPGPGHSQRGSFSKVWRQLPGRRRWLRAPRRAGAERAPLPLRPRFCV